MVTGGRSLIWFSMIVMMTGLRAGPVQAQVGTEQSRGQASQVLARPESKIPSLESGGSKPTLPPASLKGDMVSLNFSGADLVEVIHVLARHMNLNYTIDPAVEGTVTIFSAEPIKREDLLPIFHQILRMNNAVAVKTGDLYRIVPIEQGKGLVRPLIRGKEDGYALQVVPVRFFSVAELKKLLTPFLTPGGDILDYPRGNFLIIVDLPSNIKRLLEIKDLIDVHVFAGVRMELYEPKISTAEELAEEMAKIMRAYASSAAQAEGFAAQFLAIPRINRLLVISHSEAAWNYVKRWLSRIDVQAEGPGRRIFIYPVENGKATDLADLLNQVYGTSAAGPPRRPSPTLRELHGRTPRRGQLGTTPSISQPATRTGTAQLAAPGVFAAAPAPGYPSAPAGRPGVSPAPTAPGIQPATKGRGAEETIRFVADPATNSLIIFATAQEYHNVREVLRKLDLVPRQVLMDVLVAEVTLTDDLAFGIEYAINRNRAKLQGKVNLENTLPSTFPKGLTSFIGGGQDFRAVINALMNDSKVKVLSHPSILAVDNQPARIQVGSEEPVATGTTTSQVGTAAQSTTIEFKNVGRILTIIPQVNSKGLVHLQVRVEVSERGEAITIGRDSFNTFTTRDAETTAVVQDGDTLAVGGIITERKSRDRSGIPYLMDVPVLGHLFGVTTENAKRTELVILITPHVIRNREEGKTVTEEFKERLSSVKRELERMEEGEKKEQAIPPPPSAPEEGAEKAPGQGSYIVPGEKPATRTSPIKEIRVTPPINGDFHLSSQEAMEETGEAEEDEADEELQVEMGEIWRGLVKILSLGML